MSSLPCNHFRDAAGAEIKTKTKALVLLGPTSGSPGDDSVFARTLNGARMRAATRADGGANLERITIRDDGVFWCG